MKDIKIDKLKIALRKDTNFSNLENYIKELDKRDLERFEAILEDNPNAIAYEPQDIIINGVELIPFSEPKSHYKYHYKIKFDNIELGKLYYETYSIANWCAYIEIYNENFYNGKWVLYKEVIRLLNLNIEHISVLDLCCDTNTNLEKKYLRIAENMIYEVVLNGKVIKDNTILLKSPYYISNGTRSAPKCNNTIYFKTLDESLMFRGYNKTLEVLQSSKKYYQLKNNMDVVYRGEVSISAKQLNRNELKSIDALEFLRLLEDNNYRYKLFIKYLSKLFRYSKHNAKRRTLIN